MFEWKISTSNPSAPAYSLIFTSYSGRVSVPKPSVCTLPRMFMPAPWMTRTFIAISLGSRASRQRSIPSGPLGFPLESEHAHVEFDRGTKLAQEELETKARALHHRA